jgi:threonine dehydrogenase-like Zn-dependent dehydrogenase
VSERGQEAIARVRELTGGYGVHSVLECVGTDDSMHTSLYIARPGGAIGHVGVPHNVTIPAAMPTFFSNLTISGGPAPAFAYFDTLLPDVLERRIEPSRVFDRTISLDAVPEGYRAMDEREAIKGMVRL